MMDGWAIALISTVGAIGAFTAFLFLWCCLKVASDADDEDFA